MTMSTLFADKTDMQHRLFAELSAMFGREVPLYDKSLLVNRLSNRAVCDLLAMVHPGFSITDEQIDKTSGERHGAIRIGRPDEYRWVARFFACFAMEPHNFYDMANVGSKSQPIVATAFRSVLNPEHRVFCSLLLVDSFDDETTARINEVLAQRRVFPDRAKALIEKAETCGGLDENEANELIRAGTDRIFKWTGRARDYPLFKSLCDGGFKIAADIACFESHHLNHLTPNTFCMDLYTAAMKHCMGLMGRETFVGRATTALQRLADRSDGHSMRLLFRHLSAREATALERARPGPGSIATLVDGLADRLSRPDLALHELTHAGFKDSTEGPSENTPVLLRQDAYRALTEPVVFTNPDGTTTNASHTARFGEIEQRGYATTAAGCALYDACLLAFESARHDLGPDADHETIERTQATCFARFPKTLPELVGHGLVYARYEPTDAGLAAAGTIETADPSELVRLGHARFEGQRYEDFLPVSAAGIFASNLNQYGTRTASSKSPTHSRGKLEEILGRPIIEANRVYAGVQAETLLHTLERLGVLDRVAASLRAELESAAEAVRGLDTAAAVG
tara:strand:- start:2157 stop:3866 length:1710 start_codon:yes stop_codon:yes gene_type:complete